MSPQAAERRAQPRLPLEWTTAIRRAGDGRLIYGRTRNLSSGGLYCLVAEPFSPGELLEVALDLPENADPRGRPVRLLCRVSVLRQEPAGAGFGIACRIDDFEVSVDLAPAAMQHGKMSELHG